MASKGYPQEENVRIMLYKEVPIGALYFATDGFAYKVMFDHPLLHYTIKRGSAIHPVRVINHKGTLMTTLEAAGILKLGDQRRSNSLQPRVIWFIEQALLQEDAKYQELLRQQEEENLRLYLGKTPLGRTKKFFSGVFR